MHPKEIENSSDVRLLVDAFYTKVQNDDLLSPVFALRIAADEWPQHLQRLYAFWNAVLFAETGFSGNPMEKHFSLPIGEEHFARWLQLFNQTVDENFYGDKAAEAKKRAASIAAIMQLKTRGTTGFS